MGVCDIEDGRAERIASELGTAAFVEVDDLLARVEAVTVAVPAATAVSVTVAPVDELTELAALTANTVGSLETQFTVRPLRMWLLASLG